jgi:hypothetical protein
LSKDDAKGHKRPLPGHYGAFFAPFLPKNPLCAKIPRIMREKNTRFLLEIFRYTLNLKMNMAKNTRLTLLI